ncbi:MAG: hydantoinase/oxoprolinase family protein [Vicinamibacterales bacterium]
MEVVGWDIGGVNTKVALVRDGRVLAAHSRPFELQRAPHELPRLLTSLATNIAASSHAPHAVTMTAELSQMFTSKREGVAFVVDAVSSAFPNAVTWIYAVDGDFHTPVEAKLRPLRVAAANWSATAEAVANLIPNAILIDTGTTTTDIIPLSCGRPVPSGRTDPERLASGELVYTGAVRTPVEAIVAAVPLAGGMAGVSAEGFALAADVHLWRGSIQPDDYSVAPPDGRPATRESAGLRLARVVCADREMLDDGAITAIADAVADAQIDQIARALGRVRLRHPHLDTAVVAGTGEFLAAAAARAAGLTVLSLSTTFGPEAARSAPAASVAFLLEKRLCTPPVSA